MVAGGYRWPSALRKWNDSLGNIVERDFGQPYGAILTVDALQVWTISEA